MQDQPYFIHKHDFPISTFSIARVLPTILQFQVPRHALATDVDASHRLTQLRHFRSILSAHVPFYNRHFVMIRLWEVTPI